MLPFTNRGSKNVVVRDFSLSFVVCRVSVRKGRVRHADGGDAHCAALLVILDNCTSSDPAAQVQNMHRLYQPPSHDSAVNVVLGCPVQ